MVKVPTTEENQRLATKIRETSPAWIFIPPVGEGGHRQRPASDQQICLAWYLYETDPRTIKGVQAAYVKAGYSPGSADSNAWKRMQIWIVRRLVGWWRGIDLDRTLDYQFEIRAKEIEQIHDVEARVRARAEFVKDVMKRQALLKTDETAEGVKAAKEIKNSLMDSALDVASEIKKAEDAIEELKRHNSTSKPTSKAETPN